jgi:hypothetical protein
VQRGFHYDISPHSSSTYRVFAFITYGTMKRMQKRLKFFRTPFL